MKRVGIGANHLTNEKTELEKENARLKEMIKALKEEIESLTNEKAELEKENTKAKKADK